MFVRNPADRTDEDRHEDAKTAAAIDARLSPVLQGIGEDLPNAQPYILVMVLLTTALRLVSILQGRTLSTPQLAQAQAKLFAVAEELVAATGDD